MKSKIPRIIGVGLALVLVFSLGVSFLPANTPTAPAPAEAADLAWSTVNPPSTVSNVLVGMTEDLGPVAPSPDFANDNTIFAAVNAPATQQVYKSTDGGHTWSAPTSPSPAANITALVLSPYYASDSTIFFATQAAVFRSVNGGSTYGQMGAVGLSNSENITSLDVAPDYDGVGLIAVGVANCLPNSLGLLAANVTGPTNALQVWGLGGVLAWTSWAAPMPTDVCAIKFSPNYANDSTLLAVTSSDNVTASGVAGRNPYLRAIVGSGNWDPAGFGAVQVNDNAGNLTLSGGYECPAVTANCIYAADIALPSDYLGTEPTLRRAYVTIVTNTAGALMGNVYRVTGATAGSAIATAAFIATNVQLSNIDYTGDYSSGTLLGGNWAAKKTQADVYRTTNPADAATSVTWYAVSGAANKPSGTVNATAGRGFTAAWAAMTTSYADDSTVIVGTTGNASAAGISTDGAASFNETGLIENNNRNLFNLGDIALSPNYAEDSTIFLTSNNSDAVATTNTSVWVSYDGGSHWDRCFVADMTSYHGGGIIAPSNDFSSASPAGTVYVGDHGATTIWASADGGKKWSARTCSINIETIASPDATTVYAGERAAAGVASRVAKSTNSGWTWPASLRKNPGTAGPIVSLKVKDSTLVAGGSSGTVRLSDDGGATWSKVSGSLPGASEAYVDFEGAGTTVYAADNTTGQVRRSVDGGAWDPLTMLVTVNSTIKLILTDDGTLYMANPRPMSRNKAARVSRCINPTAPEPTPGTLWEGITGLVSGNVTNLAATSGSNILAAIVLTTPRLALWDTGDAIRMYTDTLSAGTVGPGLVAPAKESVLTTGRTFRFTIEPMPKVTAYQVRFGTDPEVKTFTPDTIIPPSAQSTLVWTAAAVAEAPGTIYWKVRATAPFVSPWSETWSFEVQITVPVEAPRLFSPGETAGSTVDVSINPVLNWEAFKYATGYEMQMAKDAGMTDFIADLTGAEALGNVTSWKCTTTLDYSTTYFWRVRAIKGVSTSFSDWSAITGFTTMAKPVPPTPPVIIEPAPPAPAPAVPVVPTTPSYIWAIIGIGAVLVIVVIALIVRTRRPA